MCPSSEINSSCSREFRIPTGLVTALVRIPQGNRARHDTKFASRESAIATIQVEAAPRLRPPDLEMALVVADGRLSSDVSWMRNVGNLVAWHELVPVRVMAR